jgi:two-component system response regulator ResD
MAQQTIMIIEDDRKLQAAMKIYLEREGYAIKQAFNGVEAFKQLDSSIHLILLDVMMPYLNGFDVCEQIRKENNIPIIMLTARSQEQDKLKGFELGADDYVTKPFSLKELSARIKALLKRAGAVTKEKIEGNLVRGNIAIELNARTVSVNGKLIEFARKEFDLLSFFMYHPGQVFTREQLLYNVWDDQFVEERTVDTHIKQIREKLGSERKVIATVWGVGYRFAFNVEQEKE